MREHEHDEHDEPEHDEPEQQGPRMKANPIPWLRLGAAVLGVTVASLAWAQEPPAAAPDAPPQVPLDVPVPDVSEDAAPPTSLTPSAQALMQLHVANQVMIAAAELTMNDAESELVRRYGERLWRDHRMSDQQVEDVAEALGVRLEAAPPDLQPRLKQAMQQLQAVDGSALDRSYVFVMKAAREQMMLPLLAAALAIVEDPRVVELIEETTPILEQHIVIAEYIEQPGPRPPEPEQEQG